MQNQLAEFKLGRIVLHLLCSCQDKNFPWHWRGIVREISQGALLVSPTSKCDATERCFENETETDSHGNRGGSRTENHSCLKTMKTKILLIAVVLLVCLHAPQTLGQLGRPLAGSSIGQSLRNAATVTYDQSAGLRIAVDNWTRRARAGVYSDANFCHDYATALGRFVTLRTQFNYAAELALQLGRPDVNNAVAELDEGLDIIVETFAFLQEQYNAGTLDRVTVVRTTEALQKALREWEYNLRGNGSRLGLIW